jgi:dUTP pyrophosphatase
MEEADCKPGNKRSPSIAFECAPLKVKKLSKNATLPARASEGAAGYDLYSAEDVVIHAGMRKIVKTDLSVVIPKNHYGRIAPRSGLSWKKSIDIGAGVIDFDYRGPVGMLLVNNSTDDFEVKKGDRVAQLLLERVSVPDVVEVEDLDTTERGVKGFGSTGIAALEAATSVQ